MDNNVTNNITNIVSKDNNVTNILRIIMLPISSIIVSTIV